jgi:hypothetical protein
VSEYLPLDRILRNSSARRPLGYEVFHADAELKCTGGFAWNSWRPLHFFYMDKTDPAEVGLWVGSVGGPTAF